VAFGTSLPELVTSVTAATRGKTDIAIGNIVGSNIFNILFVVGTTALITPVAYSAEFLIDSVAAIGAVLLLLVLLIPKKRLGRVSGAAMLICYAAYFAYLIK
jgi:cation:H+ antiporter